MKGKVSISPAIAKLPEADQKRWIADRKKKNLKIAAELDKALVEAKEKLKKDESAKTSAKSKKD